MTGPQLSPLETFIMMEEEILNEQGSRQAQVNRGLAVDRTRNMLGKDQHLTPTVAGFSEQHERVLNGESLRPSRAGMRGGFRIDPSGRVPR